MIRHKQADLPLHGGQAPAWLFKRMTRLAGILCEFISIEFSPEELLYRLADPIWFQAFGCVLGFDWHSSGLTTVTCGAIKEAYKRRGNSLGIHVAGGKGSVSRKTPEEIDRIASDNAIAVGSKLIYASKISAKVDSSAVQDGYQLYHHCFFFDDAGRWAVVQQGMNEDTRYARRYHWFAENSINVNFVNEPHTGIITDKCVENVLNMIARKSAEARRRVVDISKEKPEMIIDDFVTEGNLFFPAHHDIRLNPVEANNLRKIMRKINENQPESFEELLGIKGVGAKTIRSLALIAELLYNTPVSRSDPARYSFAHGGKDGHPFPVDRQLYDNNIAFLEDVLLRAKFNPNEKDNALRRLQRMIS